MGSERSRDWMWSRAVALLDEAERRHRRFFGLAQPAREPVWEPPIDLFLLERELNVVIAMPGVSPESVSIELHAAGLWVRAESHLPVQPARSRILRLEIPYGRLERRIELPAGRYEVLGHEFRDGCLRIRLAGEWT